MRQAKAAIALEGLPSIFVTAFATLVLALLGFTGAALLFFALTLFTLNFFRDPERVTPAAQGLAVSPADGKVVAVKEALCPISGRSRRTICIFMNIFNVHVNRTPVAGKVAAVRYFPGKFVNASLDKASEDNERNALQIEDPAGRLFCMVQIAGLIARRIVCRVEPGDSLGRGERVGMIKFGSRVDLYLPEDYIETVTIGMRVVAGETVVARLKSA